MKDGIYRVTLTIDGQPVVAEARVRNGVFQGLGDLAGIVGVFATDADGTTADCERASPDRSVSDGSTWQRSACDQDGMASFDIDATELPNANAFAVDRPAAGG